LHWIFIFTLLLYLFRWIN